MLVLDRIFPLEKLPEKNLPKLSSGFLYFAVAGTCGKAVDPASAALADPDGEWTVFSNAGAIVGSGTIAAHHSLRSGENNAGYLNTLWCVRKFSAVSFACAMVRKSDFIQCGMLDETLGVAYNDIDFCLRMISCGKKGHLYSVCGALPP